MIRSSVFGFALLLLSASTALAVPPERGLYLSEDGAFSITIDGANSANGQIRGTYVASFSPIGEFAKDGVIGSFAFVGNSRPPYFSGFRAQERPEGRPFVISDNWVGVYEDRGLFLLTGSRSFVDDQGTVQVRSLGTMHFEKE